MSIRHKQKRVLQGLGIAECIIGTLTGVLAIATAVTAQQEERNFIARLESVHRAFASYIRVVHLTASYSYSCAGAWCGVAIIIIGVLGTATKIKPTRCMYIANMTMSIIAATVAAVGLIISALGATSLFFSVKLGILNLIIALMCFAGMIITIVHSAFCCTGVCCDSDITERRRLISSVDPQHADYPRQQSVVTEKWKVNSALMMEDETLHHQNTSSYQSHFLDSQLQIQNF